MDITTLPSKYRKDITVATDFLKTEGCQAVYLFGSMVTGKIHANSDIDIGVKGLPAKKFFRAFSVLDRALDNKIDIVDFDENVQMFTLLNSLGEVVQIG
jgi:predicted nucleotidyltransferase